jgi:hypothetical protein
MFLLPGAYKSGTENFKKNNEILGTEAKSTINLLREGQAPVLRTQVRVAANSNVANWVKPSSQTENFRSIVNISYIRIGWYSGITSTIYTGIYIYSSKEPLQHFRI